MRIRVQVAAIEVQSTTAALVKLYPVLEQPEKGLFAREDSPSATFAIEIRRDQVKRFEIGREFDLLFCLPISEIPDEAGDKRIVREAVEEARIESLHGIACNLRTGEGTECNCGTVEAPMPAPDHDVTADPSPAQK